MMKIIKSGKVYKMGYNCYDVVAKLPSPCRENAVGNAVTTTRELRQDKESGRFYVATTTYGSDYSRDAIRIDPVNADEAARMAEDFLEYDDYVRFFGDPEGVDKGLERERDKALEAKRDAEQAKDFWYDSYRKANGELDELKKRIAELEKEKEKEKEAEDGENY